ncbi:MAG: FG-GAP-like repeat-containing protein [Hyphomonadaceae bacterium]
MKTLLLSAAAVTLLAACAASPEPNAACPAPSLTASPLIVGDGALDRGFPGGVSLADVDGDGDLDLMATGGYSPVTRPLSYRRNVLYLNDGGGTFTHANDPAWETADNPFSGSAWGDADGDGDLDAFVSTQHRRPDVFYRNLGGGRFAREALSAATETQGSNFSSTWADIDQDGDLDLSSGGPTLELAATLQHYRNDDGRFVRVEGLPIDNGASNPGAIIWADFDNDGDPDLFAANSNILRLNDIDPAEHESPQLYRNDGGWRFERIEGQGFSDIAYASAAAAAGDIDNDGDLDIYLGMYRGADHIFLNDGAGRFSRDARFVAPVHEQWATSAAFADFDGDGDLDLLSAGYQAGIALWVNDGTGAFTIGDAALLSRTSTYSGAATGDIDGDGDLDAVVGNWGETTEGDYITLLRNEGVSCGRPLRLDLRDRNGAPDPIGARVTLVLRQYGSERLHVREASGQSGLRSQSGSHFLFSVPAGARVVSGEIRWPDGERQAISGLRAGESRTIRQGG